MAPALGWKTGFEIELLAPPGLSRRDLAERVAARRGDRVRRFFHPQSEPSKVPGRPVFENLTLGFELLDREGRRTAAFVDDLTLQADLDRNRAPLPGWYRILADDPRLLRLAMRHCDAEATRDTVMAPFAALFGTEPQTHATGVIRVVDERAASVAMCARLPGERERPCEIVTAPIETDHQAVLEALLGDARALGFTVPREGATHIHFDAALLRTAGVLAAIVDLFGGHRDRLRAMVGVNPNCIRLGNWPPELAALTTSAAFRAMDWPEARAALRPLKLTKYCDFNLVNLIAETPGKDTIEIRILPATLDARQILDAAMLFEALLRLCINRAGTDLPGDFAALLAALPPHVSKIWQAD